MDSSCLMDNSIPMTKSNRITPISDNISTCSTALMRLNPYGPIITPVSRKPIMEGSLSLCSTKTITTEKTKRIRMSCNNGKCISYICLKVIFYASENIIDSSSFCVDFSITSICPCLNSDASCICFFLRNKKSSIPEQE